MLAPKPQNERLYGIDEPQVEQPGAVPAKRESCSQNGHPGRTPVPRVYSLEDPAEYWANQAPQVSVSLSRATSPEELRAFLRCDPDVIIVGEIREPRSS